MCFAARLLWKEERWKSERTKKVVRRVEESELAIVIISQGFWVCKCCEISLFL